jgi:putative ABC transport system substrate-binding protein
MDRRAFVTGGVATIAVPRTIHARPAGRVYRLGVLEVAELAARAAPLGALRQGLTALGFSDGRNLVIDYRSANGHAERCPDLAIELVRRNVDVIVTSGVPAALAAKRATRAIPIVMASSDDPVAAGIVASLTRPGANVTGLHAMAPPELGGRRLRLLNELLPGLSRVGVLWNSRNVYAPLLVSDTEKVARAMGVQLRSLKVHSPSDLDRVFEAALLDQVEAVIAVEDHLTLTQRARIVDFAALARLPTVYGLREFVEAGGLMAYGTDRQDLFRRSATYVHDLLEGARPADLPVAAPTRFELVINGKTAARLGLTIPSSLRRGADTH